MNNRICTSSQPNTKIFQYSVLEKIKDANEDKYETGYQTIIAKLQTDLTAKAITNFIASAVSEDLENLIYGLLMAILTHPTRDSPPHQYFFMMTTAVSSSNNDRGLEILLEEVNRLVTKKLASLKFQTIRQLVWLVGQLVKKKYPRIDQVCWNLLRCVRGGDLSETNRHLTESIMKTMADNLEWLYEHQELLRGVIYTYSRILEDYGQKYMFKDIKDKIAKFVTQLIRDRFSEAMVLGRDLVRVLQSVARVPEVEELWRELIHRPQSLHPDFTGVAELLRRKTPIAFLKLRVTADMEEKLNFLMSQVPYGRHHRYWSWFSNSFLSNGFMSPSLRVDLIRYLVSCVHPSNQQLQSSLTPRHALLEMLLYNTNQPIFASCKLALCYDILFFDKSSHSVMDIEPAMLIIRNSVMHMHDGGQYIGRNILDFLARLVEQFHPDIADSIRISITESFQVAEEVGILQSIHDVMFNKRFPQGLKSLLADTFESLCLPEPVPVKERIGSSTVPSADRDVEEVSQFSDDDEDMLSDGDQEEIARENNNILSRLQEDDEAAESSFNIIIRECEVAEEKDIESLMDKVYKVLPTLNDDQMKEVALKLSSLLMFQMKAIYLRDIPLNYPVNHILPPSSVALFSHLRNKRGRVLYTKLLSMLQSTAPLLAPQLLLYCACVLPSSASSVYEEFCRALDPASSPASLLVTHLAVMEARVDCIVFLISQLHVSCPDLALHNVQLMQLLVSWVDAAQLRWLVCEVVAGRTRLLTEDCRQLLEAALAWETVEQWAFWQIVDAHKLKPRTVLRVLPSVSSNHDEFITFLVNYLSRVEPSYLIIQKLSTIAKEVFTTILLSWIRVHEEKVAAIFASAARGVHDANIYPDLEAVTLKVLGIMSGLVQSQRCEPSAEMARLVRSLGSLCSVSEKQNFSTVFRWAGKMGKSSHKKAQTRSEGSGHFETRKRDEKGGPLRRKYEDSDNLKGSSSDDGGKGRSGKRKREEWVYKK